MSEIVKVEKKNSTEQSPVGGNSNDEKCTHSVAADFTNLDVTHRIQSTSNEDKTPDSICVDSNQLEKKNKENSSPEYDEHDHVIDRNGSTENMIVTSPENEENDVPPCEHVTLKSTSNEEKMVKPVVHEENDVSMNVRNVQQNKIENQFPNNS